jgi:lactate dehydrogenase-like 2-hydroxyacid dehydrogenase
MLIQTSYTICNYDVGNYTLSGLIGVEVCRKTVGMVGTGAIGACAARIWKASSFWMAGDTAMHGRPAAQHHKGIMQASVA